MKLIAIYNIFDGVELNDFNASLNILERGKVKV